LGLVEQIGQGRPPTSSAQRLLAGLLAGAKTALRVPGHVVSERVALRLPCRRMRSPSTSNPKSNMSEQPASAVPAPRARAPKQPEKKPRPSTNED
jgi:hypothetical protein